MNGQDRQRHVVMTSGGITSWATAHRVINKYGRDHVTLLFADTLVEDADLYRFLDDISADLGLPITRVADGRTPQQVNRDKRWLGNARIAPCSHLLKQKPCRDWLETNGDPTTTTLHLGIEWTTRDANRIPGIRQGWAPWTVNFPLLEEPLISKEEWINEARRRGIKPPRLYELGFEHNNCGGSCVRGGQGQWAHLLKTFPERYASWESHEDEMSTLVGRQVTILRTRAGGSARPLPLIELRQRIAQTDARREAGSQSPSLFDEFDWGGCSCFTTPAALPDLAPPPAREEPTMTDPNSPDGTAILDQLYASLTKYVILPNPETIDAAVLWIAATHAQDAWTHAPRLVIKAPEKRCGKSRFLDIVAGTCHRPLITVNASTAAIFRSISDTDPPTILLDEADTIFGGNRPRPTRTCAAYSTQAINAADRQSDGTTKAAS